LWLNHSHRRVRAADAISKVHLRSQRAFVRRETSPGSIRKILQKESDVDLSDVICANPVASSVHADL